MSNTYNDLVAQRNYAYAALNAYRGNSFSEMRRLESAYYQADAACDQLERSRMGEYGLLNAAGAVVAPIVPALVNGIALNQFGQQMDAFTNSLYNPNSFSGSVSYPTPSYSIPVSAPYVYSPQGGIYVQPAPYGSTNSTGYAQPAPYGSTNSTGCAQPAPYGANPPNSNSYAQPAPYSTYTHGAPVNDTNVNNANVSATYQNNTTTSGSSGGSGTLISSSAVKTEADRREEEESREAMRLVLLQGITDLLSDLNDLKSKFDAKDRNIQLRQETGRPKAQTKAAPPMEQKSQGGGGVLTFEKAVVGQKVHTIDGPTGKKLIDGKVVRVFENSKYVQIDWGKGWIESLTKDNLVEMARTRRGKVVYIS